jgi:hypothetical protein
MGAERVEQMEIISSDASEQDAWNTQAVMGEQLKLLAAPFHRRLGILFTDDKRASRSFKDSPAYDCYARVNTEMSSESTGSGCLDKVRQNHYYRIR